MFVFGSTTAEDFGDEVVFGEKANSLGDIVGGVAGDGVAGGALVAGSDEAVEGEGIEVGGRDLLF